VPLELHKQHRARDDLLRIWLYTAEVWGVEQADRYLDQLEAGFDRLRENPFLGADYSVVRAGYRRLAVERHRVFYFVSGKRIEIVRVLHDRMDVSWQLRE
jgi:toxin ParE1/3/4